MADHGTCKEAGDVRSGGHIGIEKPDLRAFEAAYTSLDVRPETCLFIDDVAVNVAAAQAAGMQAHPFEDNARTITRIAANTSMLASGAWLCSARRGARVLLKSKVDLYTAIRRDARGGMSLRALVRKYGVGYETVQKALISALPTPQKKMEPTSGSRLVS
ncbi:HAD-IA family hydrolase [Streptomyces sp. H27-H1]|uniref:HAD-IA family hydrolase n=1 Tax=Streptomyces sp. H27-H1 TaxID=2996461 RepID=UPI003B641B99